MYPLLKLPSSASKGSVGVLLAVLNSLHIGNRRACGNMVCHPCPHSLVTRADVREELAERAHEVALLPEVEEPKDAAAKLIKLRRRPDPPKNTGRVPIKKSPITKSRRRKVNVSSRSGRPSIARIRCRRIRAHLSKTPQEARKIQHFDVRC